jgi:hypothetical protein
LGYPADLKNLTSFKTGNCENKNILTQHFIIKEFIYIIYLQNLISGIFSFSVKQSVILTVCQHLGFKKIICAMRTVIFI